MVKVYTTTTCSWCKKLKDYLKSNNIEFEEINVSDDINAREEMLNKSKQMGVPVTDIDGKIIIGFDKPAIDKELNL